MLLWPPRSCLETPTNWYPLAYLRKIIPNINHAFFFFFLPLFLFPHLMTKSVTWYRTQQDTLCAKIISLHSHDVFSENRPTALTSTCMFAHAAMCAHFLTDTTSLLRLLHIPSQLCSWRYAQRHTEARKIAQSRRQSQNSAFRPDFAAPTWLSAVQRYSPRPKLLLQVTQVAPSWPYSNKLLPHLILPV